MAEAYDQFSVEAKQEISLDGFSLFIDQYPQIKNSKHNIIGRTIKTGGLGTVEYRLKDSGYLKYSLIKEDLGWKVYGIKWNKVGFDD